MTSIFKLPHAITPVLLLGVILLNSLVQISAQTPSLAQDPKLNNLVHPTGYQTAANDSLGAVVSQGTGSRHMILIPGLGFSGGIYDDFMKRWEMSHRLHAITLPGFGGSRALAMPAPGTSYSEIPWTRSAQRAILALMDKEEIKRATIVAHWALASQIALQLALDHPDRFDAVILIAGVAKSYYANSPEMMTWTTTQRVKFADSMGERWFRTVTRKTWDDNNFMSYDYAVNPRRGLFLWREAATPDVAVWIRYLLEFYAIDLTPELSRLKVPVLLVKPGFDDPGFYVETGKDYMRNLCLDSWKVAEKASEKIEVSTISGSRLFIIYDKPDELDRVVRTFLTKVQRN
jgi:pimeloyl-ACP methyl ester carboxylesterase